MLSRFHGSCILIERTWPTGIDCQEFPVDGTFDEEAIGIMVPEAFHVQCLPNLLIGKLHIGVVMSFGFCSARKGASSVYRINTAASRYPRECPARSLAA
jgi:hypothetical protein